jgi:hypothetical protein
MVESKVKHLCENSKPLIQSMIEERKPQLTADVERIAKDYMTKWLREYGIKHKSRDFMAADVTGVSSVESAALTNLFNDIGEKVNDVVNVAVGAIVTTIAAVISGGAGVSLIASGPIGWIVGAIIGLAAYLGIGQDVVQVVMEKMIREWKFGSLPFAADLEALHWKLSESDIYARLEEGQKKLQSTLVRRVQNALLNYQKQLVEYIDRAVERVIKDLSILEQIRSADAGRFVPQMPIEGPHAGR